MAATERIPEIALSAAWHQGQVSDRLVTTDGESIQIVHRGTWTHGLGPDFADALLLVNERDLRSGSVEMHLETRDWASHGHHLDPAYNSVVLHVVARHDGSPTRRSDGRLVPVVEVSLPDIVHLPLAVLDWGRVGGAICAAQTAKSTPGTLREILITLGDIRISARSAQIEAVLLEATPAEVLWRVILGGLGFSRNQSPMRQVAEKLPLANLSELLLTRPSDKQFPLALGLLLGVAGFLPLAPTEANLIRLNAEEVPEIESGWRSHGAAWHTDHLTTSAWDRARIRPANHPIPRLHAASALAYNALQEGGLVAAVQSVLRSEDPVAQLCSLTQMGRMPGIGKDRAIEILASGILPVVFAIGSHTGDDALVEMAARHWEKLPAPTATSVTKRALKQVCGAIPLRGLGARGAQGLIHLDTALCLPRRCFECPVAAAELAVNE